MKKLLAVLAVMMVPLSKSEAPKLGSEADPIAKPILYGKDSLPASR